MKTHPLNTLAPAILAGSILLTGCGNDNTPSPNADRTGPSTDQPAHETPDDPAGLAPTGDDTGNTPSTPPNDDTAPTPRVERPAPSPSPSPAHDIDPDAGRVATINGSARLPFPDEGERLTEHLTFTRLADHDAFENPIDPEDIPDVVPWEEAGQYVGHTITVEGRIVDIGQTRDGNVFFLNFHADWRGKFYLVVFDDLAETLEDGVEGTFLNKLVRVEGLVEDHRGRPQVKVESMEQVEFVEE